LCKRHGGHETYQNQNYFCERHKLAFRLANAISLGDIYWVAPTLSVGPDQRSLICFVAHNEGHLPGRDPGQWELKRELIEA
jgi:hypothetical protein